MLQQKNNNKIALVTGASRGIGAATAVLLAKNGYDVAVNYLKNKDAAEEIVAKARSFGVRSFSIAADLGNENEIIEMFQRIDEELGSINYLVNNGGVSGGKRVVAETSFEYLQSIFLPNVYGVFICCREILRRIKKSGDSGSIVNISSLAAKLGGFNMSAYAASKAAINNFTIAFAREAAEFNIRVNAIAPGVILTDVHHGISQERITHFNNSIPLKRIGNPEEVANAILWLLSDDSSYISGAIIDVTGGKS